jgi:hypothetical protein
VSVFRPSARTTAPDGREWEIYAYKVKLRDRAELEPAFADTPVPAVPIAVGFMLLDAVLWFLGLIPRALVRLVDAAVAGMRALRSDEWTIEAVSFAPRAESIKWTTTREFRGQVLAQVEGGLARGENPRPRNATYIGAR